MPKSVSNDIFEFYTVVMIFWRENSNILSIIIRFGRNGVKRNFLEFFEALSLHFQLFFNKRTFYVLQIQFCTFPFDTFLRASFYNIQHSRMKSLYFCVIRKTNFRNVRSEVFSVFS